MIFFLPFHIPGSLVLTTCNSIPEVSYDTMTYPLEIVSRKTEMQCTQTEMQCIERLSTFNVNGNACGIDVTSYRVRPLIPVT